MAETSLIVVVPGLFGPADPTASRGGRWPAALDILLARADRGPAAPASPEALLFGLFGHEATAADLPVAAVTAGIDMDGPPGGWWLRADPVHLRPDRDTLVFMGPVSDLSAAEAAQLVHELDSTFRPRGWELVAPHPGRWYLRLPEDPHIRTHMPSQAAGRDIRGLLPRGERGPLWHALMNEIQMQLHMSPVNAERQRRGATAVNSLWFWGSGAYPRLSHGPAVLWCDDIIGRGLARAAGIECRPVPADARGWEDDPPQAGSHALVLCALHDAIVAGDGELWRARLQSLNDGWAAPLLAALRRRRWDWIKLVTGAGDFLITPWGSRRWWRRRAPTPGA